MDNRHDYIIAVYYIPTHTIAKQRTLCKKYINVVQENAYTNIQLQGITKPLYK